MYRVEDYPQIQGSYYLTSRGAGASRRLRGKVTILTCFLCRGGKPFPDASRTNYYAALHEAMRWLEDEAKKRGVPLTMNAMQFNVPVPADANPRDGYRLVKDFLHSATAEEAQTRYEARLGVDETPFILVFDEDGRSFAFEESARYASVDELSVVFRYQGKYRWTTLAHELLHQFGAQDLYFPAAIREKAETYFHDSIMGIGSPAVDDLTAYLIGWKDTVNAYSYHFLKDTLWMTPERYNEACRAEWKK